MRYRWYAPPLERLPDPMDLAGTAKDEEKELFKGGAIRELFKEDALRELFEGSLFCDSQPELF